MVCTQPRSMPHTQNGGHRDAPSQSCPSASPSCPCQHAASPSPPGASPQDHRVARLIPAHLPCLSLPPWLLKSFSASFVDLKYLSRKAQRCPWALSFQKLWGQVGFSVCLFGSSCKCWTLAFLCWNVLSLKCLFNSDYVRYVYKNLGFALLCFILQINIMGIKFRVEAHLWVSDGLRQTCFTKLEHSYRFTECWRRSRGDDLHHLPVRLS